MARKDSAEEKNRRGGEERKEEEKSSSSLGSLNRESRVHWLWIMSRELGVVGGFVLSALSSALLLCFRMTDTTSRHVTSRYYHMCTETGVEKIWYMWPWSVCAFDTMFSFQSPVFVFRFRFRGYLFPCVFVFAERGEGEKYDSCFVDLSEVHYIT